MRTRPRLPGLVLVLFTVAFLVVVHFLVLKMLSTMDQVAVIGPLLKNYLLSAVLLCLFFMLIFSNLINALSAFFLSRELEIVLASPLPFTRLFAGKFTEVMLRSSWMVILLMIPVMTAYGSSYGSPAWIHLLWPFAFLPYTVFCTSVGSALALLLAVVLPVRRAATVLRFIFVVGIGILVIVLRLLQPERLILPDRFENFGRFLLSLHSPFTDRLPSYWLSRVLVSILTLDFFAFDRFAVPYVVWAAVALAACYGIARKLYIDGWRRMQEGSPEGSVEAAPERVEGAGRRGALSVAAGVLARAGALARHVVSRVWLFTARILGVPTAGKRLVEKEAAVFCRTPAIWTQTALLMVIVVIYLYNIKLLPADSLARLRSDLPTQAAFCNIAFLALVSTAAALRFGFPSVSMEGRSLLLILSSPCRPSSYIAAKFWTAALPLCGLSLALAFASSRMLCTSAALTAVVCLDAVVDSACIAALALLFGTIYADLRAHNFSELPSSWGGMLFMVATGTYILGFLALQAYPFYLYFLVSTSIYRPSHTEWLLLAAGLATSLLFSLAVLRASLSMAARRLTGLAE